MSEKHVAIAKRLHKCFPGIDPKQFCIKAYMTGKISWGGNRYRTKGEIYDTTSYYLAFFPGQSKGIAISRRLAESFLGKDMYHNMCEMLRFGSGITQDKLLCKITLSNHDLVTLYQY